MNFTESIDIILIETFNSFNLMTLPLNCYIIWLMCTGTKRTMASDMFSLNLALSDIFFSSSLIWIFVNFQTGKFEHFKPYLFSLGFLFTARPLFQTCICVDYYLGVIHPVYFLKYKPLRYRMAFCCVAWLAIFASCIYCFFCFLDRVSHFLFFIQNMLFLATVVFCCLSVLRALKKPGPGENIANQSKSNKPKQKAFRIIFLILISMIIGFVFSVVPIPFQCLMSYAKYIQVITICIALSLTSGIMQPLLYLHRVNKLSCFKRP